MADVGIEQLKEDIQADIKANNNQTITGDLLQERLIDTVDTLKGYTDDHVSVSQNTETGHTDITIGNTTIPVASVEEVSQIDQQLDNTYKKYLYHQYPSAVKVSGDVYVNTEGVITASGTNERGVYYFPVNKGDIIHFKTKRNDSGNLYAACISVTSDSIPAIGSPVLEYKYWSNIAEVDSIYEVQNDGTLYYYIYQVAQQTFLCGIIDSPSADIEELNSNMSLVEKTIGVAYFSTGLTPTFTQSASSLVVKMPGPNNLFSVYGQKGELVRVLLTTQGQAGAEFTLTNKKTLVLDLQDSQFKVVDTGTVGNYIVLLSYSNPYNNNESVDGLFLPYYIAYIHGLEQQQLQQLDQRLEQQLDNTYKEYLYHQNPSAIKINGSVYVDSEGVITASGTNERGVYYFPVNKGDIVHFKTKRNDSGSISAACISVTSDTTPTIGSPVLEYKYWSNVAEVDELYEVQNDGTLYYYIYQVAQQTFSCDIIASPTNELRKAESDISLINNNTGIAYFSTGQTPTFTPIKNGKLKVTLPGANNNFEVYDGATGTRLFLKNITPQALAEFELTNRDRLVLDLSDNTFKVVQFNATGSYINLLSFTGNNMTGIWAVEGLFKPYYDSYRDNNVFNLTTFWNKAEKKLIKSNLSQDCDFKAIFFSDIHGNSTELERIIELANDWKSDLDAIIDGGDDTATYQSETPLGWYNTLAPTAELPIARAVGNHDAWSTGFSVWATVQQIYEYFTAPTVALLISKGASVVQPVDAATAYRNYYYVDFGDVRLIVLLSLTIGNTNRFYDADQDTWFKAVLADSITNNKAVICLNHGPLNPATSDEVICDWTSRMSWNTIADNQHVDDAAVIAVDDFIGSGGEFICWLTGHTHIDYILTSNAVTHKQMCFVTSTAKGGNTGDGAKPSEANNPYYDLFNMIGVDRTHGLVKLWRIGFNTNRYLQVHNTLVWDYANGVLLSED